MDGEEAIYYLEYLRHDVHAKSLYDVALVKAIDALKQGSEPVKRGQWIHHAGMNSKCSCCGRYFPVAEFEQRPFDVNFCIHCGARMDGDTNEEP